MSNTKNTILKLLAKTKIEGRYRSILNLYANNPIYPKLTYHNVDHVVSVLNLFEVLRKLSGKGFSKLNLQSAYLAAAFHDIDHSGHPDTHADESGATNIGRAIAAFTHWTHRRFDANKSDDVVVTLGAGILIKMTEFPNKLPALFDAELNELSNMLRDADILWGTMPGNAEHCMLGLWAEWRNAGLVTDPIDIFDVLTKQIRFIQNYQPLSAAGRAYKNAMFEDASTAWSLAALQYQRQIMAAEAVSALTDDEVLALANSMRPEVRRMMVNEEAQLAQSGN